MIYLAPWELQDLLRLLYLLSKETGFGYEEMMRMPSHILLSLWNAKKGVIEEQNKAEKEAYDKQSNGQDLKNMNPASMMSQAKSMLPPMPKMGNMSMPSMGSFKAR